MNENDAYIFDVEEPKEWVFKGDPVWISGWFYSKVGAIFSDIRAVIDGVPHLGILGQPREHLERQHRGYSGLPHIGFTLLVQPPRGARILQLELLDAGGRWVEIWRTDIRVISGPAPGRKLNAGIVPDQLIKLLQAYRADPSADLLPLARTLAREAATGLLETLPNPPFYGALERPHRVGGTQFGKLRVEGWIIHQDQRVRALIASTNPLVENELDYGDRERAEVLELFPGHPHALKSQFFGMVDVDERAGDPVCLKIFAELEDGSRHLAFVWRFHQRGCNQWERPLPAYNGQLFFRIARTFYSACRAEGIRLGSWMNFWRECREAHRLYKLFAPAQAVATAANSGDPYASWLAANRVTTRLHDTLEGIAKKLAAAGPRFVVLVDTRGHSAESVQALAESLRRQIYPHWQACFVGETAPPAGEPRWRHVAAPAAGPAEFIRLLNTSAHQTQGTHLTLLGGDSHLPSDALVEIADRLAVDPTLELVYTDEDHLEADGRQVLPVFKPDWSPALADSGLFPGRLSVVRRDRFVELGSFRDGFDRVPWYDLLLRLNDRLRSAQVAHLPIIGHHTRGRPAHVDPSHPSFEQGRQALADAVLRRGWGAAPFLPETGHHRGLRYHQLRWESLILSRLQVSIVIPTRDRLHLLQECVELLDETVDWRYVKLIIVDDHSRDADVVAYLDAIQKRVDLMCKVVRTADPHAPFNYSKLVNAALPHLDTPLVLHLNNDVNALERGWLEEMAGWFVQPDVGVVGAKLVYPDKTLNHTGIVIGPHGGLADTPFAKVPETGADPVWHAAAREVSAVTGACLMTRTALYRELGGFDETEFGVAYNDVDYCLRVRARDLRVIYTPQAKLMHWGSATRGVTFDEKEHIAFVRQHPLPRDPYLSRHLELAGAHLQVRRTVSSRTGRVGALRVLLLTHNLNLEGAPLFLLEYATYLTKQAGFTLEILSSQDGPLRGAFEALGAHITLIDAGPLYASPDEATFFQRLDELGKGIDWLHLDLVVCNTLVSFWGVPLARRAGKPSLLYIHESTSVFRFFETKLELPLHRLVHQALAGATHTLFLCQATRAYYEDDNVRGNFRLVPSWIRLDVIEEFRRSHDRAAMRRKHGFADDEIIIANIGTVCERKGQHIFLRAIDHFNHHHKHRGKFRFVLVGARPGVYLDLLQRDLRRLALGNVTLVPETREVFDFFVAADLFVCTSYEESFPRVVMEAMAFRTPLVSTDVHGIAEMIGQRQDGYLVPPGDPVALSKMMWTCLAKERSGKSLTPTAYSRALRSYDYDKVLPHHVELAKEAALADE